MQAITIKINGMTCMGCVNSVKNVLEKIPGVAQAEVSLEQEQVMVQYEPEKTNIGQLKQVIEEAGFSVAS